MPDFKFEESQEARRILFQGQNMPDVMILVFGNAEGIVMKVKRDMCTV